MNITLFFVFIAPIAIVVLMAMKPDWFAGWKINVQGTLVAVIGFVQTMDLSFIADGVAGALTAGAGLATLIASKMTKREAG